MKRTFYLSLLFLLISMISPHLVLGQEIVELNLESAIDYALNNSPTIKMAEHTMKEAEAKKNEARAELLPQMDLGLNYVDGGSNPMSDLAELFPNFEQEDTPYMASLDIKQSIFASPAFLNFKMSDENFNMNRFQYEGTKQDLAFTVTNSYYEAIKASMLVEIAKSSLDQTQRNLKTSKAHYEAGMITKNQLLQVELAVAQARQNLLQAENGYQLSLASFKNTVGMDQEVEVRLVEEVRFTKIKSARPEAEVTEEDLLSTRFDLKATKVSVGIAEYLVKMAKSGYYPIAYLNVQYSQNGADGFEFDDPTETITLGVSWSVPLNGKTQASVKAAKEGLMNAKERLNMALQGVKLEVKQARLALEEAKQRAELTALALEVAEENFLLEMKRFEVGVGTAQEVNDAQVALEQAKINNLNARYDLFLSGLKLQKALGRYDFKD